MLLAYDYQDYASYISDAQIEISEKDIRRRDSRIESSYWYGTNNFQQAVDKAINGDKELEQKVLDLSEGMYVKGEKDYRLNSVYSESGDDVDIGKFLSGEPECMYSSFMEEHIRPAGKIIRVVVNQSVGSGTREEVIIMRGAAIVALTNLLEHSGYRIELVMVMNCRGLYDTNMRVSVVLKRAEEQIDYSRLCFALISPSSLRRMTFALMEYNGTVAKLWDRFKGSYGSVTNENLKDLNGDIYVESRNLQQFNYLETAKSWVKQTIEELGCVI